MSRRISRRRFMQASGVSAAAAGYWLTGGVTESFAAQPGANARLNVALIGAGGRAEGNEQGVRGENIVALCDVDQSRARNVYNRYPRVTKYTDFRVMLDKQKDIQAVVVSTPDHTHFHASAMALQRGKHVYCEKPLTHSVWEARQLGLLAAKHRVATSMGNQGTAHDGLRTAAEIIRSGAIGEVREVHVWTDRPIWPQGINRPKGRQEVPKTLTWDLWLGPAPERPYNSAYVPFAWRGWWDFGTGALGDMACHTMNMPFMALRLSAPSAVSAEVVGGVNPESAPARGVTVTYEFPARGQGLPALRLYWYESPYQPGVPREKRVYRRPPANVLQGINNVSGSGCMIVGSRGKMYSGSDYGSSYTLLPARDFADYRPPQRTIPRSPGHHAEWIRACKGGAAAMSNFTDYAGPLTEMVLLGNVAMRAGERIVWDSAKLQVTNVRGAAQYIRPPYRKGWEWNA
ncbi:MAG: Gfo/Idh/MocA family oxidoreductase [Planctomycetes bacterium]|nr:Gfo/Idh/MocA family oxidoreductase [Planctomycetota bacterium]